MAAAQLVLPGGLLVAAVPRLQRLSALFKDAECDDLSVVTWAQLARRLGLIMEV
eukprot:gene1258-1598_t